MFWFSWTPWRRTAPLHTNDEHCFAAVPGPIGANREAVFVIRENGEDVAYLPIHMGWI